MLTIKKILPILCLLALAILVSGCTSCSFSKEINASKQINISTPTEVPTIAPTAIPTPGIVYNPTEAPVASPISVSSSTSLNTPILVSPAEGASFSEGYPRTLTMTWQPVNGANEYRVEVEMNTWNATAPVWSGLDDQTITATTYTTFFGGMNPGRWRVTAIDSTGEHTSSTPSAWRSFEFTQ